MVGIRGTGSVSNVTDPEHWFALCIYSWYDFHLKISPEQKMLALKYHQNQVPYGSENLGQILSEYYKNMASSGVTIALLVQYIFSQTAFEPGFPDPSPDGFS